MNINRLRSLTRWFARSFCDKLSDIKHKYSPYAFKCIFNNGHIGHGVRIFSAFKNSIHIGTNVIIGKGTIISNYEKNGQVYIGDGTSIGWYNNFYCQGGLDIGRNVLFASYVCILTSNHKYSNAHIPIIEQGSSYAAVSIGDNCWIGYNVVILSGVSIGKHTVVGAGSIVTHDLPDHAVCAGNPCRVLHYINNSTDEIVTGA